eukprot:Hpha_TRINITY_DN4384_c0_g1::TRINITY_DN4384_c0_g1_i1::g.49969::m.49969
MAIVKGSCYPFEGSWAPNYPQPVAKLPDTQASRVCFRDDAGDTVTFTATTEGRMQYEVMYSDGRHVVRPPFRELIWDELNFGLRMPDIGRGCRLPRGERQLSTLLAALKSLAGRAGVRTDLSGTVRFSAMASGEMDIPASEFEDSKDRNEAAIAVGALRKAGICRVNCVRDLTAAVRQRLTDALSFGLCSIPQGTEDWEKGPPPPPTSDRSAEREAAERGRYEPALRKVTALSRREQLRCCWLLDKVANMGVSSIASAGGLCGALSAPCGNPPSALFPFSPPDPIGAALWGESVERHKIALARFDGMNELADAEWNAREDIRIEEESRKRKNEVEQALKEILLERLQYKPSTAELQEQSYPVVHNIAHILDVFPEVSLVSIEGHVNPVDKPKQDPVELSEARAVTAKRMLHEKGVGMERMTAVGRGDKFPLVTKATKGSWEINCRVEFKVMKMTKPPRRPRPEEDPEDWMVYVILTYAACCLAWRASAVGQSKPLDLGSTLPTSLWQPSAQGAPATALCDPRCSVGGWAETPLPAARPPAAVRERGTIAGAADLFLARDSAVASIQGFSPQSGAVAWVRALKTM